MSENSVPGDQSGVKTPEEVHAEVLADPSTPAVQAEVLEEVGPQPVPTVKVAMGNGVSIDVPMQVEWRVDALEYMTGGQFIAWAESVLAPEDLGLWDEWWDSNPKLGEVADFFERVGKATGVAAGMNRASRRSSQRTQRR